MKIRAAFSMIELIFIILIIGILTSIALPKLSATRMDAKLSIKAHNISVAAREIAIYALSHGETTTDFLQMSSTIAVLINSDEATIQPSGVPTLNIKVEDIPDCIIIKIENQSMPTEILRLTYGTLTSENCDVLRSFIDSSDYPMPLRGNLIR